MAQSKTFDPGSHLSIVDGKEYLEVKWRLAWVRATHPEATIDTELVWHNDGAAAFKAAVSIPDGGSATGHGSEAAANFPGYFEAAETKAIGRALAALGFGTQFVSDREFASGLADAPVARTQRVDQETGEITEAATKPEQKMATGAQIGMIYGLVKEKRVSPEALASALASRKVESVELLTSKAASEFITRLQSITYNS